MTDHLTENARLRAALRACINMLDDLVVESGRGIEYGEEDAFRMGEWFDDHDLGQIDTARAALATPAPDAVQEAARVLLADGVAMQTLVDFQLRHSATASAKARSMRHVQMKAALRAIAGGRT